MENQQLVDFIKASIEQGKSKEEIKKSLLASGWQDADIEKVFTTIFQNNIQPAISQNSLPQIPQTGSTLPGVFSLVGEAWGLYKQRAKTFVGIMLVPAILFIVLSLTQLALKFFDSSNIEPKKIPIALVFSLAIILLSISSSFFQS